VIHSNPGESGWVGLCRSVRGSTHARRGMPNQDYINCSVGYEGAYASVAAADGHGSSACFRSDAGARIAVEVALDAMTKMAEQQDSQNLSFIKDYVENKLPGLLVAKWRKLVEADFSARGFSLMAAAEDEIPLFDTPQDTADTKSVHLAYGTTLISAMVTAGFLVCIQIGDGEILLINEDGSAESPVATDERLFANETTSLCSERAVADFRVYFERFSERKPKLIIVSTDGYINSFKDRAGFLRVGTDILDLIRNEGFKHIEDNLEGWLSEASRLGSGDDTSLGILFRK